MGTQICDCGCGANGGEHHRLSTANGHHFRVRATGYSSRRYGVCEVCGEHASEVYIQAESDERGRHVAMLFGHEACLAIGREDGGAR